MCFNFDDNIHLSEWEEAVAAAKTDDTSSIFLCNHDGRPAKRFCPAAMPLYFMPCHVEAICSNTLT